jgi:hypothetical protein
MIVTDGVGPPGPESATPRRQTEAARKSTDDDAAPIVHPPKPGKADLRRMRQEYRILCQNQAPIERAFWALEQRKGQLADKLANEGIKPFCRPRDSGHPPSKRKPGFQP